MEREDCSHQVMSNYLVYDLVPRLESGCARGMRIIHVLLICLNMWSNGIIWYDRNVQQKHRKASDAVFQEKLPKPQVPPLLQPGNEKINA